MMKSINEIKSKNKPAHTHTHQAFNTIDLTLVMMDTESNIQNNCGEEWKSCRHNL